jgi:hypothetical protein
MPRFIIITQTYDIMLTDSMEKAEEMKGYCIVYDTSLAPDPDFKSEDVDIFWPIHSILE